MPTLATQPAAVILVSASAVQIQQRQHLVDLRGLARPRRQNRRAEPPALTGIGIDPAVVDPRRTHPDRAGAGQHLSRLVIAVAHHQPLPALVELVSEPGNAPLDLGLQRLGQHPPGTLTNDLIDHRRGLAQRDAPGAAIVSYGLGDYGEHGRTFPTDATTSAETRWLLDFNEPIGLLMLSVLHVVSDEQRPGDIVAAYRDRLSAGHRRGGHRRGDRAPRGRAHLRPRGPHPPGRRRRIPGAPADRLSMGSRPGSAVPQLWP